MLNRFVLALSIFLISQSLIAQTKPSALAEGLAVDEVLEIVNKHNQKPAHLIINLVSGNSFKGTVESLRPDKNVFTFKNNDNTTSVIKISEVSSLSVVDPGSAKIALQGYKIIREEKDPVPSSLDLKRMVKRLDELEGLNIKTSLSANDLESLDCRYYTEKVLLALEQVRNEILKDEEGKFSAKPYQSINLISRTGATLLVSKNKTDFTLEFDCTEPLMSNYATSISEQINKQL